MDCCLAILQRYRLETERIQIDAFSYNHELAHRSLIDYTSNEIETFQIFKYWLSFSVSSSARWERRFLNIDRC